MFTYNITLSLAYPWNLAWEPKEGWCEIQGITQGTPPAHISNPTTLDGVDQGRNLNLIKTYSKIEQTSARPELQRAPQNKPWSLSLHSTKPRSQSAVFSHVLKLHTLN